MRWYWGSKGEEYENWFLDANSIRDNGVKSHLKGRHFGGNFFSFLSLKDTIIVILVEPKTKELSPYWWRSILCILNFCYLTYNRGGWSGLRMAKSWDWVRTICFPPQLIPTGDVPNFCRLFYWKLYSTMNWKL